MTTTDKPMHRSHGLDGNRGMLQAHYRQWAADYDTDVIDDGYVAPRLTAELATMEGGIGPDSTAPVLDVGCGTGLVGRHLKTLRPTVRLYGVDLSPEMAELAGQTGAYERVGGDVDLLEQNCIETGVGIGPVPHVVCCGTLTNGHIGPEGVQALLDMTAPDGTLTFSVRLNHSRSEDFDGQVHELADRGAITVLSALYNAPYIGEEGADYFTLRKLATL